MLILHWTDWSKHGVEFDKTVSHTQQQTNLLVLSILG
jgi:hypothetical protein